MPATITVGALERPYSVHLPAGYDRTRPVPLIVMLHGARGTGAQMDQYGNLGAFADRAGCIVAFPDGGVGEGDAAANSDDGSLIEIGGERVVANDGAHPAHARGSRVALAAGLHVIRIAFFEAEGDRVLELSLAAGDGPARRLGADDFVTDAD